MKVVGMLRRRGDTEHLFFVLDEKSERLVVTAHGDQEALPARPVELSAARRSKVEERVRALAGFPVEELRVGEYCCPKCGAWERACRDSWSHDICFDCSFEQASAWDD